MVKLGTKLIIASLLKKDISTVSRVPDDWWDGEEADYASFVKDYYRKNTKTPSVKVLRDHFADVTIRDKEAPGEPGYYYDQLQDRKIYTQLTLEVPRLLKRARKDPKSVLRELKSVVGQAGASISSTTDVKYHDDAYDRFDAYEGRKSNRGVTYLSTGSEVLNDLFYGWQRGDLVTIAARSGIGKTWFLIYLNKLLEDIMPGWANDALFITNEMPIEQIQERRDCIEYKLPYGRYMKGMLTTAEERRYREGLLDLEESRTQYVQNCRTLKEVEDKILLYRPSIVFLDGSYLLEKQTKLDAWVRIEKITVGLKEMSMSYNIPIINTTQLKRGKGIGTTKQEFSIDAQEEFAFGGSYINDSDLAIPLFQTPEMSFRREVGGQFAKGRRVDLNQGFTWLMDLERMLFSIHEPDDENLEEDTVDY